MGSAQFLEQILILRVFLLLYRKVLGQGGTPSLDPDEKNALYVLKSIFNNSILNESWKGDPCDLAHPWYGIQCSTKGNIIGIELNDMGLSWKVDVNEFMNFPELIILSFQNNALWGNVMNFSFNHKMRIINLSGNKLDGSIPGSLLSLSVLESLQLQDNNLRGTIPEFNQSSLLFFYVSNNNLTGSIPKTQTLQSFSSDSYSGNPGLYYGPPLTTTSRSINGTGEPPSGNSPPNSNGDIVKNIFLVFVVILIAAVILLLILYCQKAQMAKKRLNEANKEEAGEGEKIIEAAERSIVVAAEESRNLIFMEDEPAFGIGDGPSVVVKRLRDLKPMTSEEFKKQLRMIGDMTHPNLLPLLAYSYSNEEKFLLYNYAAKGNLFDRIHGERGRDRIPFKWNERLSVAQGIVQALEYLHLNTKCQSIVVPHGNLKSSNVLFDENDKVLISDYGLTSRLALPIAIQHMVSYKSPEYRNGRKVSKQSNVWSHGCLLLELLTGKISARRAPPGVNGTVDLYSWVHRAFREEWTAEVFDLEISMQRNAVPGMLRLLQIPMQCCDNTLEERPEMTQMVREVENIKVPELRDENDESLD